MKFVARSVLLLAFVAIATQDITGRKGCDCSICKDVNNKINPIVGKKVGDDGGGKSSCNICERRKEMLRMEREKQRKLQKCPFEILGSPAMNGKTSEEIFDEFREQIVPSQNGFFDMMRGIVRTMHVSSVAELKWAKEKEARELAKKRKEEAEAAKKRKETPRKPAKEEMVGLNNPVNPKVTVVLKQTPCDQILQPTKPNEPEKISLIKRLTTEVLGAPKEQIPDQEEIALGNHHLTAEYSDDNSKENSLNADLIDQLVEYREPVTEPPPDEEIPSTRNPQDEFSSFPEDNLWEATTESPFVKFISNEEMKALMGGKNSLDDFDLGFNLLASSMGVEAQEVDNENDFSAAPLSL